LDCDKEEWEKLRGMVEAAKGLKIEMDLTTDIPETEEGVPWNAELEFWKTIENVLIVRETG
jgi:hypothetical protein